MKDNGDLEPLFISLFKHHWVEEAQHAKLDALELEKLLEGATEEQRAQAEAEYVEILDAFSGLLGRQAALDVQSLEAATGKTFSDEVRKDIEHAQTRSYQRAFLWYGLANPLFCEYLAERFPALLARASELTARYGQGGL